MIKIGHFADTHLGYRQYGLSEREIDFYEQFKLIIDDMIEKNVDLVIHSGDLFEQAKPPIKALLVAQEGFLKLLNNNIPVYVIAGNHDKFQKTNTSIPQELYENENFHILSYDKSEVYNDELFIGGVSYLSTKDQNAIKEILDEIKEESEEYKYKILVLHGGTEKHLKINPEFNNNSIPYGFDYYAMGHIHNRINETYHDGVISYPGSTEIRTAKEVDDYNNNKKGYNLVTFDPTQDQLVNIEYVDIPIARKFIIESIKYPKLEEELEKLYQKIITFEKKPVLHLTVNEGRFDRAEVMKEVYDKLKDECLTIKLKYEPTETNDGITIVEDMPTAEKMIEERMKEQGHENNVINLTLDLYHELSISNTEEALRISEEFYERIYDNGDLKDDN